MRYKDGSTKAASRTIEVYILNKCKLASLIRDND